jgi:hypothetical protein
MKLSNILLSLTLAATVVSCTKKQLEVQPSTSLIQDFVFTTVTDLEQGLLSAYASWDGGNTMYINALLSDEVKISSENRGQGQSEFKYQYSSGTETFGFNAFYSTSRKANIVLTAAPKIVAKSAADETRKQGIMAEALALRAVAHFELLQRFGPAGYSPSALGVTYVQSVLPIGDKPSRMTVGEDVAAIEKDLADAKSNTALSTVPVNTVGYGNIRISKSFIAGMQARVALYKRDWTNAEAFASEAISSSGKTLATGSNFNNIWNDNSISTEPEVFLRLKRTGTGIGVLWQDENGDVFLEPSDKLKQQYNRTTDLRFSAYFQITPAGPGIDTALVKKFSISSRGPKIVDVKVMRVAEMYLIRAEARAEQNNLTGASSDINALRIARITGYTNITYTDKTAAVNDIINERYKELAFEGFRFFDLKRRQLSVNRLPSDVASSVWLNLTAGDYRFALPIPQSERQANPNQQQNPNY